VSPSAHTAAAASVLESGGAGGEDAAGVPPSSLGRKLTDEVTSSVYAVLLARGVVLDHA